MPDRSTDVVLGGRYVLGDVLGTGTSATVYEASELFAVEPATTDCPAAAPRQLAAKVLHAHIAQDPDTRAAFVREARAAARVQHPGLVTVLDVGEEDIADETVVWIIMALAPGITLAEVVASQGLGLSNALVITSRVLDALAAVHAAGLVHRDLSPGNVMVELTGSGDSARQVGAVTVLDLGLAGALGPPAVVGASPADGSPAAAGSPADVGAPVDRLPGSEVGSPQLVTGTPRYMSPEQARGLKVDARGDVYAVGALLYLMLTGHAPYERSDPAAVLRAHVQAPVPVPSARADVPHTVDRLVSRAMAKNPDLRFRSAAEMRAAVDAVLRSGRSRSSATGTSIIPAVSSTSARTTVIPAVSSTAARTTRIAPISAAPGGAVVRFDLTDLRAGHGVPSGAAWFGAGSGADSGAGSGATSGRAASGVGSGATSGRAGSGMGEVWRSPAEPPARWSGLAIVVLLICALAGVGWLAARGEPASSALPGDPPTQATMSPSAAPSSRPTATLSPSTPAPQKVAPTVSKPAALPVILPPLAVPSLASLGIEQARTRLEGAGLVLGKVYREDSAEPAGTVLASDPAKGQPVPPGSSVRLTVASGRNVVPPVEGLELTHAIALVESMGLVPLPVAAPDPTVPPGYVVGANPASGARLVLGSAVTLLVSDGPPPTAPDPVPTSTAPAPLLP